MGRNGEEVGKDWRRSREGVEKESERSGERVGNEWRRRGEIVKKEWGRSEE